ncbi:MAG: preprotein translocase subunit YajC [Candidatus Firestonebacteria bacterium]|nr:preprotein translocase subunit YajC [Candidatus Firestonebacteria bacterium]
MFVRTIYALGQTQNAGAGTSSGTSALIQMVPLVLIFGVFYFLIIRPQQQKQKKHQELLSGIKKGDNVVTIGGILGTVVAVKDNNIVTLEIASGVKIDVLKKSVSYLQDNVLVENK